MYKEFYSKDIRNFPPTTGIYAISFKNNKRNKVYIGSASANSGKIKSSKGFYCRWRTHLNMLKNNIHHSIALQNAYNKYGDANIKFIILEECESSDCIKKEQFYIDKYNSFNKGYNGRPTSDSNLGYKQSEKTKNLKKEKFKKFRDSISKKVINLYNENKTTREISKEINISRGVITKIFKENNISGRNIAFYKKIKLFQYKLTGEFIKEWDNINECCSFIETSSNAIRDVTNGRCKHAKGFYFSFIKINPYEVVENINKISIKSKNRKFFNIKQFDINENYIKTWRDVREIIEHFGFTNIAGITRALNGKRNGKYKDFYWKL